MIGNDLTKCLFKDFSGLSIPQITKQAPESSIEIIFQRDKEYGLETGKLDVVRHFE